MAMPLFDRLSVQDATVLYRDQREGRLTRLHLASLTLQPDDASGGMRLDADGDIDGQPLRIKGRSGNLDAALAATAPYPLELEVQLPSIEATLAGTIADVSHIKGLELRLEARSPSLLAVTEAWDLSVPADAEIAVNARLTGDLAALSLSDVHIGMSGSGGDRLELSGGLGNLWTGTGLDGRVGLKLDPTGPLGKLLPVDWRILNQIEATARVAGSVGALEFDDLSAEIRGPGGSNLSLSGSLEVATPGGVRVERFDLISRLEVMRTDDLAKLLGMDGGGLERFWFEGKLSGDQRRLDADGQAILGETQFDR
jgi:hypothetical protein